MVCDNCIQIMKLTDELECKIYPLDECILSQDEIKDIEGQLDYLYYQLTTCSCKCVECEHNECFDCPVVISPY